MIEHNENPAFMPVAYGYYWYKQDLLDWEHEGDFTQVKFPDWTVMKIYRSYGKEYDESDNTEYWDYTGAGFKEVEVWRAREIETGKTVANERIRQLNKMGRFVKIEAPK